MRGMGKGSQRHITKKAHRVGGRGNGRRGLTGKHLAKQAPGFGYGRGRKR